MSANDCMTVARQQLLQCKKSGRDKARKKKKRMWNRLIKNTRKVFIRIVRVRACMSTGSLRVLVFVYLFVRVNVWLVYFVVKYVIDCACKCVQIFFKFKIM